MKRYLECGCCGHYHKEKYVGDCQNNVERFTLSDIVQDIVNGKATVVVVRFADQTDDIGDYEIDKAVGFDPDVCGE